MRQFDFVSSEGASFWACNVEVTDDRTAAPRIMAGIVYLQGGLPEMVEIFDPTGQSIGRVKIPSPLRRIETFSGFHSVADDLEFELELNNAQET